MIVAVESENESAETAQTTTLLRTDSGDPLVVAANRGRGRIVQFAFPCDDAWSEIPLRAAFVPMMQQLVLDLAGSQKQTTFELGRTVSVPTDELVQDPNQYSSVAYLVESPDGTIEPVGPDPSTTPATLLINPKQAGVYRFDAKGASENGNEFTSTIRIVDVPSVESKLQAANPSRRNAVADALGATIYAQAAELQSADHTQRYGREIWRWLLALLLFAMVGEVILQQVLSHGSLRVGTT